MKKKGLYFIILIITQFFACTDLEEISFLELNINNLKDITATSFTVTGEIKGLIDGDEVEEHGFVYSSTNPIPTLTDEKFLRGKVTSKKFSVTLTGLKINAQYYVRTFVQKNGISSFSEDILEVSLTQIPIEFSKISIEKQRGQVTFNSTIKGLEALATFDAGHVWSNENKAPKLDQDVANIIGDLRANRVNLETIVPVDQFIGLDTYYVRSFLVTGENVIYSKDNISFIKGDVWQNERDIVGIIANFSRFHFIIDNEVYFYVYYRGFGKFNPITNVWTPLTNLPLSKDLNGAATFTLNGKGYVGTGSIEDVPSNRFWEYNPRTDQWTEKASLPDEALRSDGVGFSLGGKGYIGLGYKFNDFWEYDPTIGNMGQWTKANFYYPGEIGKLHITFSLNDKICMGIPFAGNTPDLWCFSPNSGWQEANPFPLPISNFLVYAYFSIGDSGFLYIPNNKDNFWEYDSTINGNGKWIQRLDFAGGPRSSPFGFSANGKGYLGLGTGLDDDKYHVNIWEYIPETTN